MSGDADFVVLHPDGTAAYGSFAPGRGVQDAIRAHVPDSSTQGMGRVRAWFADTFSDLEMLPNPLAYQVFARLGYRHASGWYGPVAVTMEEDSAGIIAPLAPDIRATVEELHARMRGPGSCSDSPSTHTGSGTAARSGPVNRIRLTPRDDSVAGRDVVIGCDRGLGTVFAQVLDGPDAEGEPIVRVYVGGEPDEITDPARAIDTIRPYAQIPDHLVEVLVQQRDAPGARERSSFAAWAQSAGLTQNSAPTTGSGASPMCATPESAGSPEAADKTRAGAHRQTADTPQFRGGAGGMDDLIADTVTGQGSDFRAADPGDDPLLLPPGPSTEYGPEL